MTLNPNITNSSLCFHALDTGGMVRPLVFDLPKELVGIMNPSILVCKDTLLVNLRCVNYTLWHSYTGRWPHWWSPMQYMNPEHLLKLVTVNYLAFLDEKTLCLNTPNRIDMRFDSKTPLWDFWGLEDARLVDWDGRLYITGVRRDTTDNGQGRMELSEIEFYDGKPCEKSRHRIPAPNGDNTYCEKNWMPVLDQPYRFVKWTSPTEVVSYNIETGTTDSVVIQPKGKFREVRGGSQAIPYRDKYIAIGHTVVPRIPRAGVKDAGYRCCLIVWDRDFNLEYISEDFAFIRDGIEFCCGMCEWGDYFLIPFGEEDNAAYIVKIRKDKLIAEN